MEWNIYMSNPSTINMLSPVNFKFDIYRTPETDFFFQSVSVPSVSLAPVGISSPTVNVPIPGDHFQFGSFSASFKVDEELINYMELYSWMKSLANPEQTDLRTAWVNNRTITDSSLKSMGPYCDGNILIFNANKQPVVNFSFLDMWPTSLGDLRFSSTAQDIDYVTCIVGFQYRSFDLAPIT